MFMYMYAQMMRYALTLNQCCFDVVVCCHDYANITVVNYQNMYFTQNDCKLVLRLLPLALRSGTAARGEQTSDTVRQCKYTCFYINTLLSKRVQPIAQCTLYSHVSG